MLVFLGSKKDRWSSNRSYNFIVIKERKKLKNIIYIYPTISEERYKDLIKKETLPLAPNNFEFDNINTAEELNLKKKTSYTYDYNYEKLEGEPEDYNLKIPETFERKEITYKLEKDAEINEEMFEKIKRLNFSRNVIIIGERYDIDTTRADDVLEYYCPDCHTIFSGSYNNLVCPNCKKRFRGHDAIVSKEFKDFRKEQYDSKYYSPVVFNNNKVTQKERFYFMCSNEKGTGITLYKIYREITVNKNIVYEKYNIEYSMEHNVGGNIASYKHLKKGKKQCDAFDVLNINTKNINETPTILYEDAENFMEWASKNEKFLKMSGFQTILKYSSINLKLEPFFIVFLGIVNKYPVMEQIVKMGHARIFFNLYKSMLESYNKNEINEKVNKISQIVNNEATKGKEALRFPLYIGDYLIKKDASIEEYYYWRDLYELTALTKEQFENFIESFNFAWVNSQAGLEDVGNILKFGYPVEKLFNYIIKQSKVTGMDVSSVIRHLTDYLNMCDITQIEYDMYPQNVKKQHDDMVDYFKRRNRMLEDKKLQIVGEDCEAYVLPKEDDIGKVGIPKLFEKMTVVFPKSEEDFINEGNQQHNCVGSYPRNVKDGRCVIFFIRYKETPNKSFITAECTNSGLGQCFYSNNRRVNDEELMKFARYIANKIKTGCNSGKIHGLTNIVK